MTKLKRDQLPPKKAENWRKSFKEEESHSFNLKVPKIILEKSTYKALTGDNENRVRVYLGLEAGKQEGKYTLCAFAVSAFLLGSGDVYADYETPVFKLDKHNIDYSDDVQSVIDSILLYRKWRSGELDPDAPGAEYRQYIYPVAYLMTKFELHELFVTQNRDESLIDFGISKTMNVIISGVKSTSAVTMTEGDPTDDEDYDVALPCPPYCDERSIYNP